MWVFVVLFCVHYRSRILISTKRALEHPSYQKIKTFYGVSTTWFLVLENHGGVSNLIAEVPDNEIQYGRMQLVERADTCEYLEYCQYVLATCDLKWPGNWRDALELNPFFLDSCTRWLLMINFPTGRNCHKQSFGIFWGHLIQLVNVTILNSVSLC